MKSRGFTLIELMVSVTIFIIVMTISLGALFSMSAADRKAEAVKTIMNNLNFALDSMTRTIRTGYGYGCPTAGTDCNSGSGGARISLTSASNQSVSYCLGSGTTCSVSTSCSSGSCSILRSTNGGATYLALTAPEVKISNLSFYVLGSVGGDSTQPRVVITLDGTVDTGDQQPTSFQIQTTATQRIYDQ